MPTGVDNLERLEAEARRAIAAAETLQALTEVRARFLGKKGSVAEVLRGIKDLDAEQRARVGQLANASKQRIEQAVAERRSALEHGARERALEAERLDVTLPGAEIPRLGHLHPVTRVFRDMVAFFTSMGFSIEEGPEVETEYHNFEALNIPEQHPARDEQDTFYLEDGNVLRTHTSNVQIRAMSGRTPPFRFIAPGRVYRHDLSPRHYPMFHQIEGFLVDERVTFADLKGVLYAFGRHLLDEQIELRFRANHFPFTEPSAEMDYACRLCERRGCAVCSNSGWIEWGGCGMIHPRVLENCGIDAGRYQGFAFGMGVDRTALLRYGIPNIRLLFDGDLRVLEQL
ncbi:MAG TPA: phenylalanine--tRNA ligase subunit alpha [Myxococcota bacterium]|nr:phenylalanine--tRNA ligase subunit alpha [Myxococcota bacterium]